MCSLQKPLAYRTPPEMEGEWEPDGPREQFACEHPSSFPAMGLAVQWFRIHLPMQGTLLPFLVREDLTCHGTAQRVRHLTGHGTTMPLRCIPHPHFLKDSRLGRGPVSSPDSGLLCSRCARQVSVSESLQRGYCHYTLHREHQ